MAFFLRRVLKEPWATAIVLTTNAVRRPDGKQSAKPDLFLLLYG